MGFQGPGVAPERHKDIDRLADKFCELLEERSGLSESIGKTEDAIKEKMKEKGLTRYQYRDQEVVYKPGIDHIKVKTVKVKAGEGDGEPPTEE